MPSFVGFIPTPPGDIEVFFGLAPLSSSDVVYDLGSGDGSLLFAALDNGGGRAVGVELNPECVRVAREAAKRRGIEDRITFLEADVMDVSLSDASVVLCYLVPSASAVLRPKFELELRPGTRVITEEFPLSGWLPDRTTWSKSNRGFYLYVMPPRRVG